MRKMIRDWWQEVRYGLMPCKGCKTYIKITATECLYCGRVIIRDELAIRDYITVKQNLRKMKILASGHWIWMFLFIPVLLFLPSEIFLKDVTLTIIFGPLFIMVTITVIYGMLTMKIIFRNLRELVKDDRRE